MTTDTDRAALLPSAETINRSRAHTRHGHTSRLSGNRETPTYTSWQAMLARCRYRARDKSNKYINRGIDMDPRWAAFESFLADMGERPAGATLDRKDNDKGYWPENCRWATPREQARNTRRSKLTIDTATLAAFRILCGHRAKDVAADLGVSESLPREIAKGRCWPDALVRAKATHAEIGR